MKRSNKQRSPHTWLIFGIFAIVLVGAAIFYATQYVVNEEDTPTTQIYEDATAQEETSCPQDRPPVQINLGGEDVRVCGGPTDGTVVAMSATSIKVETGDSETQTFSITDDTAITERDKAKTTDDIAVGDTVSVLPTDADATKAARILLNFSAS